MATPKKKYPYNFIYEDGNYMTFDITGDEYDVVPKAIRDNEVISISAGIIHTKGLRFVVRMKEPVEVEEQKDADPVLDAEAEEYLRLMRGD